MTSKRYAYFAPNGARIIGSSDTVLCRAEIRCFDENGDPEYDGYTEVWWDSQETKTRGGKPLYEDENGEEWTLDQCERVECDACGEPLEPKE